MFTGLLTPAHVAILLIVVLLILGPKRLPQAGHALGRALHEFKRGISGRDVAAIEPARDRTSGPGPPTAREE